MMGWTIDWERNESSWQKSCNHADYNDEMGYCDYNTSIIKSQAFQCGHWALGNCNYDYALLTYILKWIVSPCSPKRICVSSNECQTNICTWMSCVDQSQNQLHYIHCSIPKFKQLTIIFLLKNVIFMIRWRRTSMMIKSFFWRWKRIFFKCSQFPASAKLLNDEDLNEQDDHDNISIDGDKMNSFCSIVT